MPGFSDRAGSTSDSHNDRQQSRVPLISRASAPRTSMAFRGSIAPPARPLSTLRCALTERQRMTRGHRDSLRLRCRAFPSPAPCRFIPALSETGHIFRFLDQPGRMAAHPSAPGRDPSDRTRRPLRGREPAGPHARVDTNAQSRAGLGALLAALVGLSGERSQLFSCAHRRALSRNSVIAADRARAGHRIDHSASMPGSAIVRAWMLGSAAAACRANETGAGRPRGPPVGGRPSLAAAGRGRL